MLLHHDTYWCWRKEKRGESLTERTGTCDFEDAASMLDDDLSRNMQGIVEMIHCILMFIIQKCFAFELFPARLLTPGIRVPKFLDCEGASWVLRSALVCGG